MLEEGADLHRFQLLQTSADALSLRLDDSLSSDPARLRERALTVLRDYLRRQGLPEIKLSVDAAPPSVDPASGKLRQVIVMAD